MSGRDLDELAAVTEFESIALEATAEHGARLVKLIGDEIMFVAPTTDAGCAVALGLAGRVDTYPLLATMRAGVAIGQLLPFEGDYFGAVVNHLLSLRGITDPIEASTVEHAL